MSSTVPGTRIIVDCQLFQTNDRNRGMGLFLQGLLEGLVNKKTSSNIEWVFVLNSQLPAISSSDKSLITDFKGSVIRKDFLYRKDGSSFEVASISNRAILDKAVEHLLKDDIKTVFFIPALFSSEIYPVFPTNGTVNILLFHDIIPFLYHQHYFQDHEGEPRKDYAQRFREFYRADLFVTNSQTTADDLTTYFGVDPSRMVAILGAAASRSGLKAKSPQMANQLKDGFVLMPSGDDFRKNNNLAVQAFASLNNNLKLVITSNFSPGTQRVLTQLCPSVVFTGSVSDEEFLWLVNKAKAVFFPTEYEGLGMPILEALEGDATVVCSNIPVFVEISQEAFFFFDPKSVNSMTEALETVLDDNSQSQIVQKRQYYPAILDRFSWVKTADLFLSAVQQCMPVKSKKRLAIFCPSPASYSAVGKYAFEVHAELSRLYDIDYYAEDGLTSFQPSRPNILEYAANYYPAQSFTIANAKDYDHILYNIGNSEFHVESILNSLQLPANTVIHDTRLDGIFDYMENRNFISPERRQFEALLDRTFDTKNTSCLVSIATNQKTVFCHSEFARAALDDLVETTLPVVMRIAHPIGVPSIELARSPVPTISFAGIISEDKGIGVVSDVSKLDGVQVKVFGFGVLGDSPLLQGLSENVDIMKDLSDKEFQDALQQTDILVNYRINYHGETSRSTLEAMRHGVTVIVKDIGWYGELPNNTVVKVESELEVMEAIRDLIKHPEKRRSIAAAARKFLTENYSYKEYAEHIAAGIEAN